MIGTKSISEKGQSQKITAIINFSISVSHYLIYFCACFRYTLTIDIDLANHLFGHILMFFFQLDIVSFYYARKYVGPVVFIARHVQNFWRIHLAYVMAQFAFLFSVRIVYLPAIKCASCMVLVKEMFTYD